MQPLAAEGLQGFQLFGKGLGDVHIQCRALRFERDGIPDGIGIQLWLLLILQGLEQLQYDAVAGFMVGMGVFKAMDKQLGGLLFFQELQQFRFQSLFLTVFSEMPFPEIEEAHPAAEYFSGFDRFFFPHFFDNLLLQPDMRFFSIGEDDS